MWLSQNQIFLSVTVITQEPNHRHLSINTLKLWKRRSHPGASLWHGWVAKTWSARRCRRRLVESSVYRAYLLFEVFGISCVYMLYSSDDSGTPIWCNLYTRPLCNTLWKTFLTSRKITPFETVGCELDSSAVIWYRAIHPGCAGPMNTQRSFTSYLSVHRIAYYGTSLIVESHQFILQPLTAEGSSIAIFFLINNKISKHNYSTI